MYGSILSTFDANSKVSGSSAFRACEAGSLFRKYIVTKIKGEMRREIRGVFLTQIENEKEKWV